MKKITISSKLTLLPNMTGEKYCNKIVECLKRNYDTKSLVDLIYIEGARDFLEV